MLRSILNKTKARAEEQVLVYFPVDNSLAVVKKTAILPMEDPIAKDMACQVKDGTKIYEGKIIEIGDAEALRKAEEFYEDCHGEPGKREELEKNAVGNKSDALPPTTPPSQIIVDSQITNIGKGAKHKGKQVNRDPGSADKQEANNENKTKRKAKESNKEPPSKKQKRVMGRKDCVKEKNIGSIIVIGDGNEGETSCESPPLKDNEHVEQLATLQLSTSIEDELFVEPRESSLSKDSLTMGLAYDELEERVCKLEELLKESCKRIELLEATINGYEKLNGTSMDQQQFQSNSLMEMSYSGDHYDVFEDSTPLLPEPIDVPHPSTIPPAQQPTSIPHQPLSSTPYQPSTLLKSPPVHSEQPTSIPHQPLSTTPYQPSTLLKSPPVHSELQSSPSVSQPVKKTTPMFRPVQPSQYTPVRRKPSNLHQLSPASYTPRCFPVEGRKNKESLPSTEIEKENLVPYDRVLKRNPTLQKEGGISTLALKLSIESVFGIDVLKKCTVMGCREFPALPLQELNELKQLIFSLLPKYWNVPAEFETKVWSTCVTSIGQKCKRLRTQ